MANRGAVLSTNYLLDAVWGKEFAGADRCSILHGLATWHIEEDPRRPRYIRSSGVGYAPAGELGDP